MLKKLGNGMSAGDEKKKLRTRTKQRIGNEATDRAGVQVRVCSTCSHFSFSRSLCSFSPLNPKIKI